MRCRRCGDQQPDDAFTCTRCGADLSPASISHVTRVDRRPSWALPMGVVGLSGLLVGALMATLWWWQARPDRRDMVPDVADAEPPKLSAPDEAWLDGVEGLAHALQARLGNGAPLLVMVCREQDGTCDAARAALVTTSAQDALRHVYKVRLDPRRSREEAALAREYKAVGIPSFCFVRDQHENAVPLPMDSPEAFSDALREEIARTVRDLLEDGRALLNQKHVSRAMSRFEAALALEPMSADAHHWRGLAFEAGDQIGDAASEFKEVLKLDPDHLSAREHLGYAYLQLGRLEDARRILDGLVARSPDYGGGRGLHLRGLARGRLGDRKGAVADLSRACELGVANACVTARELEAR